MRRLRLQWMVPMVIALGLGSLAQAWTAQQPAADEVSATTVVSVEAKHGKEIPVINKEDVRVMQGRERLRVTDWVPLQGQNADLELLILIDEDSRQSLANQWDDVRKFMDAQPPTTAIGVGYMEYGTVRLAQNFTKDRQATDKALRITLGRFGGDSSPYLAVSDIIKHWPQSKARHAIFMISSGIDALQPGTTDSYLDAAIEDALRSGIQISTIYVSMEGHFGHSYWRFSHGQDNLAQLAEETGGESYFEGFSTPVSFTPFLDEFANRLGNQYQLTFLIKPGKKPSFQHVRLETEVPNADLVTADQIFVPAAPK